MSYSQAHIMFLQGMLSRRVVTEENAKAMLLNIYETARDIRVFENDVPQEVTTNDVDDLIRVINNIIMKINMEIKKGICEVTENTFYVLINTVNRPINKLAVFYTKNDLIIFQKLLGEIVVSEESELSSIACINLEFELASHMSLRDIEAVVEKFVKDGWFVNKEGMISLGIRSIMEMEPYLKAAYKDYLNNCPLCKLYVFKGKICGACSSVFHSYCMRRFLSNNQNPSCANCSAPWIDSDT